MLADTGETIGELPVEAQPFSRTPSAVCCRLIAVDGGICAVETVRAVADVTEPAQRDARVNRIGHRHIRTDDKARTVGAVACGKGSCFAISIGTQNFAPESSLRNTRTGRDTRIAKRCDEIILTRRDSIRYRC